MKLVEILNANVVLGKLAEKELKFGLSRKIAKNVKAISEEVTAFEEERGKIAQKYSGETQEDFNQAEFAREINELLVTEVEGLNLINFYEAELEEIELTPKDILSIEFLIKEDLITVVK
ncbi:MAG: hypothetical protein ACRC0V_07750 [Fusobacteriaceae bacterium]